ncbi:MAG: GNAT family N-acetyltransferase [Muribaculaceae bacterium]|nr:GNAT family N-acetyltransferase [Muribaculaceae bacterium]
MMQLQRYTPGDKELWNRFVAESNNGTFLFDRNYMDYHSDRFTDYSFLVYKGGSLRAMLPCNIVDGGDGAMLYSHQGLTYGGWILPKHHLDGEDVMELFSLIGEHMAKEGIEGFEYKKMPYIYGQTPFDEDRYALYRLGAVTAGCDLSSAIRFEENPGFNTLMRRHLKKAGKIQGVEVREYTTDEDIDRFHRMLERCLLERHGEKPVHTAAELRLLHSRFPDNIRIIACQEAGEPRAGVVLYLCATVVHVQYICSTPEGRERGLLTYLFDKVINAGYGKREYFDFGISTEDEGAYLNTGLLRQKYSLGGRGVVYEKFYFGSRSFLRR